MLSPVKHGRVHPLILSPRGDSTSAVAAVSCHRLCDRQWSVSQGQRLPARFLHPPTRHRPGKAATAARTHVLGPAGQEMGSFFLPFSLFSSISTSKTKLLRDNLELFAKSAFYHHREKTIIIILTAAPPPRISSTFSASTAPRLQPWLSSLLRPPWLPSLLRPHRTLPRTKAHPS